MKRRLTQLVKRRMPALLKVLASEFGARAVIESAALNMVCLCLLAFVAWFLPGWMGWGPMFVVAVCACVVSWRYKAFDSVGQILCAFGCIKENLSQEREAKYFFQWALFFLRHRLRAYKGLCRLAESPEEMQGLAQLIKLKEQNPCSNTAVLMGHCFREAGDFESARTALERADQLCSADTIKLDLSEVYLKCLAAEKSLETVDRLAQPDANGRSFFLRSAALQMLGRTKEALLWANRAAQLRPCDPDYQLHKGKILETLGQPKAALRQYTKSIRVHPRNPEAFYHRGLLRSEAGDLAGAAEDFQRCCYFQNTWTEAYLLAQVAKQGAPAPGVKLANAPSSMQVEVLQFHLEVGQIAEVNVAVRTNPGARSCQIRALEPFGFGLEVSPQVIALGNLASTTDTHLTFRVRAKRPHAVNLSKPWVLNFVLTTDSTWASQLVQFRVEDTSPGRIFLVLTEDHETSKKGTSQQISPDETECDLATKTYAAQALAEKYSLKWTHLLDAGIAISLPKWAANLSPVWNQVWRNIKGCYRSGLLRGHDHQVHLHLSAVPESSFFCYSHAESDNVVFDLQKRGKQVNSWANVVRTYGRASDPNSRLGSLVHSANTTGTAMGQPSQPYQPSFFRAGQWDLGNCTAEREKSVMALRESFFLADSSVTEGYDCTKKPFRFGSGVSRAAYFTFRNNPEKPAQRLRDAGILEVVPILLPQGNHPVEPRDDPAAVLAAYRTLLRNGRVKPGRHLILEIEHLFNLSTPCGKSVPNADWAAMEHHFATLAHRCTALEGVTATEAIEAWLDYYTPELVVRVEPPTGEAESSWDEFPRYRFPLRFLGQGILGEEERLHHLVVPLPYLGERNIKALRILRQDQVVLERSCSPSGAVLVELSLSARNQRDFTLELELDDIPSGLHPECQEANSDCVLHLSGSASGRGHGNTLSSGLSRDISARGNPLCEPGKP